ncbi:MAG: hypothetical protein C0504_04695 [Candidatus Solibacter sp.]|nr:hypothetical protein [Candidatus Solibacter sp.]
MRQFEGGWRRAAFWAGCLALLLGVRLCHVDVLWVDEAYGLAAARRMLEGAELYRGVWFDKPPLYAWIYLAWGAETGWALRVGGALFALLCCWLAARTADAMFGRREGYVAAALMAFYLSFGHPAALISLAPDLLLIPFALGAVWAAQTGRPVAAGIIAAAGLLANAKALVLLPVILIWRPRGAARGAAGYAAAAAGVWLAAGDWLGPVWQWGAMYSREALFANPLAEGAARTVNWAGFHAALVMGAAIYFARREKGWWRMAVWVLAGLLMVAAGMRFFPRYYFALLPALTIAAARGICLPGRWWVTAMLAVALIVPAVRFGSRHVATLRGEPRAMRDLALFADAREAASAIRKMARPGDTLLVWGYRPELNVLAGLPGATRFIDSQPLTGVIADRHLTVSTPSAPELAARFRRELAGTRPAFIADGLGKLNAALAIERYGDLGEWLEGYEQVAETEGVRIYRRRVAGTQSQTR